MCKANRGLYFAKFRDRVVQSVQIKSSILTIRGRIMLANGVNADRKLIWSKLEVFDVYNPSDLLVFSTMRIII